MILKKWDCKDMIRANEIVQNLQQVNNIEKVFQIPTPSIRLLNKTQACAFITIRIVKNVTRYWKGMERTIDPEMAKLIAEMIVDDYSSLKLTEIDLVFRNAVMGTYGPTYENLNIERILSWFSKYWESRAIYAEQRVHHQHMQQKSLSWSDKILQQTPAIQAPTKTYTRLDQRTAAKKGEDHQANMETLRLQAEDAERNRQQQEAIDHNINQ